MRAAGEQVLAHYRLFASLDGAAEATGLPTASVDFVTAGQAFHWFDPARARIEFRRILKPDGWVVLVWNERRMDLRLPSCGLTRNCCGPMPRIMLRPITAMWKKTRIPSRPFWVESTVWRISITCRFLILKVARACCRPLMPRSQGHPHYKPMMDELRQIFNRYQQDGRINFEYDTRMYYGFIQKTV